VSSVASTQQYPAAPATGLAVRDGSIHSARSLDGINRYYVLCTRDRAIPPPLQRRMIAENVCADVIEFETDHTPHLSMTSDLAKALYRFATHSSQALEGCHELRNGPPHPD
jgi:hypothetical protein